MTWSFLIAFIVDCIALLIAVGVIIYDSFHSRSADNSALSIATLVMGALIGIAYYLHTHGSQQIGTTLVWVPAFPILGYGLILLLMVVGKPDFK